MPPRNQKRQRDSQAAAEERAMKRIDRAVKRYGPSAVAKYYSPVSSMRPEMKYFDLSYGGVQFSTANDWSAAVMAASSYIAADGTTVTAYNIAPMIPSAIGSGYGQVIGSKYRIRKLKLRGTIMPEPDVTQTYPSTDARTRMMVLMDKQPNGSQVQPSDLLTDWGTNVNNLDSFLAVGTAGASRYRVLYDKTFIHHCEAAVNNATAGSCSTTQGAIPIRWTKTFKKPLVVSIKSNSSTPAVASLYDTNIFIVGLHYNQGNGNIGNTKLWATSRCCYVD